VFCNYCGKLSETEVLWNTLETSICIRSKTQVAVIRSLSLCLFSSLVLVLHFNPEDGSNILLRIIGKLLPDYTTLHLRVHYNPHCENVKFKFQIYVCSFLSVRMELG
jgi:hypothetical protein